jgi:hypothetical protein
LQTFYDIICTWLLGTGKSTEKTIQPYQFFHSCASLILCDAPFVGNTTSLEITVEPCKNFSDMAIQKVNENKALL